MVIRLIYFTVLPSAQKEGDRRHLHAGHVMLDFSKLLDPKTQRKYEVLCLECNVSNFF